jgi:uncharacterized membrane protein (UPF0136 family)
MDHVEDPIPFATPAPPPGPLAYESPRDRALREPRLSIIGMIIGGFAGICVTVFAVGVPTGLVFPLAKALQANELAVTRGLGIAYLIVAYLLGLVTRRAFRSPVPKTVGRSKTLGWLIGSVLVFLGVGLYMVIAV